MNLFKSLKTLVYAFKQEPLPHVLYKLKQKFKPRGTNKPLPVPNIKPITGVTKLPISIVMPTYNTKPELLEKTIKSVLDQTHEYWQLCIYDDGSTNPETIAFLQSIQEIDNRIDVHYGTENLGIALASNACTKLIKYDYTGFLDHDDVLHKHCLSYIADRFSKNPKLSVVYTDELSITEQGNVSSIFKKASFDINAFRCTNYVNHLTVIKTALGENLKWFTPELEGAQDYDLLLRIYEVCGSEEFDYIPYTLYSWRQTPQSISKHQWAKKYVETSGMKALDQHYKRIGVILKSHTGYRIGTYKPVLKTKTNYSVTIHLNFAGSKSILKQTIQSLLEKTEYALFTIKLSPSIEHKIDIKTKRTIAQHNKTNQYLDNQMITHTDFNCYINHPVLITSKSWLSELVHVAILPENHIVAPTLLLKSNKILSQGFKYREEKYVNLNHMGHPRVFKERLSGIITNVQRIYNICYLCARNRQVENESITVTPFSEIQVLTEEIQIQEAFISEAST